MQIAKIGLTAKTMYGDGVISKLNDKSVIVNVNGTDRKFSHKQFGIMNNKLYCFVAGKAN